jgi:large subunit ribosomal protein L29
MKTKELRQKTKPELEKILREDKEKLRELRFNLIAGKVKNVREIRKIKKDIAKIITILSQ